MTYIPGRQRKYIEETSAGRTYLERVTKGDIDVEKLKAAYIELEHAYREVKESQIEIILSLALAAEYKDTDTGGHILRISDYATELARAIGLDESEVDHIRYGSPMHDIGKIGIPDRILQKPDKLTTDEYDTMKQHAWVGSKMFQNSRSPILRAASIIALTHHERYDGTGYPQGLKGEDIPLFGRIVAVADVFDALVSKRCYKASKSFDEGMSMVVALGGTQLDPKLTAAFKRVEPRIREIYDANMTIQHFVDESAPVLPTLDLLKKDPPSVSS